MRRRGTATVSMGPALPRARLGMRFSRVQPYLKDQMSYDIGSYITYTISYANQPYSLVRVIHSSVCGCALTGMRSEPAATRMLAKTARAQ